MGITPCPVCGEAERLRTLETYRNKGRRILPERELVLAGCERCGLAYTVPRPTDEQLERYYGMPGGWEARQDRGGRTEEELRPKLASQLGNKRRRRAAEFDLLRADMPQLERPGTALDFGCGLGGYLDVLQVRGWETWGIEPGPRQRAIAAERHLIVKEPPAEETFDFVILNHVLEHLRDPLAILHSLAAAMRPGGVLFVSVPDLARLGEHGRLTYVRDERHICSWTAESLGSALGLPGFRPLAHLSWDDLAAEESWRLKLAAERAGAPVLPAGTPLAPAIDALASYAAQADRFRREKEARAERKLARRPPAPPRSAGRRLVSAVRGRLGL